MFRFLWFLSVKEVNIKEAATALSTCINLLLPHPDDFFIVEDNPSAPELESAASAQQQAAEPDSDDSDEGSQDPGLREVGMVNLTHSIQLEFVPSECTNPFNTTRRNQRVETVSSNFN